MSWFKNLLREAGILRDDEPKGHSVNVAQTINNLINRVNSLTHEREKLKESEAYWKRLAEERREQHWSVSRENEELRAKNNNQAATIRSLMQQEGFEV